MKIEKVNENQIRCTLTREDLASRELKISELAYGTEKAKSLFRDMMKQANYEFGFEAEDIPLMIEAIPLNAECIVLIITKVEDPEELDTRFSRFAPSAGDSDEDYDEADSEQPEASEEVMDLFRRLHESSKNLTEKKNDKESSEQPVTPSQLCRIFQMDTLQSVLAAAHLTGSFYTGESALYKDERTGSYLLVLSQGSMSLEDYNKVSNVMTEYGHLRKSLSASLPYLEEHYTPLIAGNALNALNAS